MTTIPKLLEAAFEYHRDQIHVALPGTIKLYNPLTQTASIQVDIKSPRRTDQHTTEWEDFPMLLEVPIRVDRSTTHAVYLPPAIGDRVRVTFCERDLTMWATAAPELLPINPVNPDSQSIAGATADMGLYPTLSPLVGMPIFNEGAICIGKDSAFMAAAPANNDFVAWAGKVLIELNKIATAFNNHTHIYVPPAVGYTATPVASDKPVAQYTPAAVACSDVKVS